MLKRMLLLIPLVMVCWASETDAAIYYYVDGRGVTHFCDYPKTPEYKLFREGEVDDGVYSRNTEYDDIIKEASAYYRVDPAMVKAMIRVESNFNHRAVSPKGAMGLMQLMPATAARLRVSDPFNPIENVWAGVYYVKCLMVRFKYDYNLVFAAYNAGEGAVEKYGGIPPYRETRGYVQKVHRYWEIYRKQDFR